ncbi:MAG: tetratricopeptide repeat protein [Calditrichota bacterium]
MSSSSSTTPAKNPFHKSCTRTVCLWVLLGIWCGLFSFALVSLWNPPWLQQLADPGKAVEARDLKDYGDRFMQIDNYGSAAGCYRRALQLQPDAPDVELNLAVALWRGGNDVAAEQAFRKLIAQDPQGLPKAYLSLAEIMAKRQQWADAVSFMRQAIAVGLDPVMGYRRLGAIYSAMQDWPRAREALENALASELDVTTSYHNMLRQTMDDLTPDSTHFDSVQAAITRTMSEADLSRYDLKIIREQQQHDPAISETCHDLGIVYLRLGNLEKAEELVRRSLEIWPGNTIAQKNLPKLVELRQQQMQSLNNAES